MSDTKPTSEESKQEMVESQTTDDQESTQSQAEETAEETTDAEPQVDDATQNIIDSADGDTTKLANQIRTKDAEYNKQRQETEKAQAALKEQQRKAVDANPYYLLDIYKEDPQSAREISEDKWGLSYEDIEAQMYKQKDELDAPSNEELIQREVDKKFRQQKEEDAKEQTLADCNRVIEEFVKANNIDSELEQKLDKEYKFVAEGKNLTPDAVKKLLKVSYISVTGQQPGTPTLSESEIEAADVGSTNKPKSQPTATGKSARAKEISSMFSKNTPRAYGH